MAHRSRSRSGSHAISAADPGSGLLSETEQSSITEKVDALSKEAEDLRGEIKELETRYDTTKMSAKQHDKLVKQYLLKLFDINRELLPMKERIEKDAEERERMKIRQKLEASGIKVKAVRGQRIHKKAKTAALKVRSKRRRAKR